MLSWAGRQKTNKLRGRAILKKQDDVLRPVVPPRRQTEGPGHAPASGGRAPPSRLRSPEKTTATNADGCRFRDSFKYTEGASFKVGDCVMVQLEGEGVREGESPRHAAAQILQIWWPAPEEDEDEDEPWAEVRWLYCAEEIVPAKKAADASGQHPDREVFETTHVDEVPASSLMGCIEVLSYDAYVQRRQKEDRKAMKDVFFVGMGEPGAQLTECGPAAERCRRPRRCVGRAAVLSGGARPGTATW